MIAYDPVNVIARSSMTNFERAKGITEDAMQACEISINLIKHELTYLQASLTKGSLKQQGIDTEKFIDKLTKFFQVTAPYCIERKDGKKVDDATPDSQLHKLMNKSMPLRKTS